MNNKCSIPKNHFSHLTVNSYPYYMSPHYTIQLPFLGSTWVLPFLPLITNFSFIFLLESSDQDILSSGSNSKQIWPHIIFFSYPVFNFTFAYIFSIYSYKWFKTNLRFSSFWFYRKGTYNTNIMSKFIHGEERANNCPEIGLHFYRLFMWMQLCVYTCVWLFW